MAGGELEDQIALLMSSLASSGPEAYLAARQVKAWKRDGSIHIDDLEHSTRLYMALKQACPNTRVTSTSFAGWAKKMEVKSSIKRVLYLVPTTNELDDFAKQFTIDPALIKDWPCAIPPGSVNASALATFQAPLC